MPNRLAALALAAVLASSCTGQDAPKRTALPTPLARPAGPQKVLLVVEENHGQESALQRMPALASAARRYGYATHYEALAHPSLPNYLALVGGSRFGVTDDADPAQHQLAGRSVFDEALARGRTAKVYADAMGRTCARGTRGTYAPRHNPWTYFAQPQSRANCVAHDVASGTSSAGALATDIRTGHLPNVGMLIPDTCHDAHDCSLADADAWLAPWLTALEQSPDWRSGRLTVVVTFDEDEQESATSNNVLTVVMSPALSHVVCDLPLTHYSTARYLSEVAGAAPVRDSAGATSLGAAFGLTTS